MLLENIGYVLAANGEPDVMKIIQLLQPAVKNVHSTWSRIKNKTATPFMRALTKLDFGSCERSGHGHPIVTLTTQTGHPVKTRTILKCIKIASTAVCVVNDRVATT